MQKKEKTQSMDNDCVHCSLVDKASHKCLLLRTDVDKSVDWELCLPRVCLPFGWGCLEERCINVGASVIGTIEVSDIKFIDEEPLLFDIKAINCSADSTFSDLDATAAVMLDLDIDTVMATVNVDLMASINGPVHSSDVPVKFSLDLTFKQLKTLVDGTFFVSAQLFLEDSEMAIRAGVQEISDLSIQFEDITFGSENVLEGPVNKVKKLAPNLTENFRDVLLGVVSNCVEKALNDRADSLVFNSTLNLSELSNTLMGR